MLMAQLQFLKLEFLVYELESDELRITAAHYEKSLLMVCDGCALEPTVCP